MKALSTIDGRRSSKWYSIGRWEIAVNPWRWLIGAENYLGEYRVYLLCVVIAYKPWMRT